MAAFIGRTEELSKLDEVYECNIRNCYIDAKPRSGATTLVKRFCEKSRCIYTTFRESTDAENLRAFRSAIEDFIGEPVMENSDNFADLFHAASKIAKEYEPIMVFDGTQYVPDEFPRQLKWFTDEENLMVILIGHGDFDRYDFTITEKIDLDVLSREECRWMHQKMSSLDALKTYMTLGGCPLYNSLMNKSDYAGSVEKAFLGNYPKLVAECELTLRKSSVPYDMCGAILSDIANCIGRPIDIADKEGISRQLGDIYLKKLVEEDLICTLNPIGNAPKKPVYIIKNPMIAFYFTVIRMNPEIEFSSKVGYDDISRYVDMFLELRFRDICEDYIRNNFKCVKVGRWWQKEEDTQKPTLAAIVEIDGKEQTIVADCKFRSGKIDQGALKALSARAELIEEVPEKTLMIFSISGFDDKLIKKAKAENVILIGPDKLL